MVSSAPRQSDPSASALPSWLACGKTVSLLLYVKPGSKTDAVMGEFDGRLKISLNAPAVDGRANEALIRFLSKKLGVPKSAVEIVQGATSRLKRVSIKGASAQSVTRAFLSP